MYPILSNLTKSTFTLAAYFDPFVRGMLVALGTQAITVPLHMTRKDVRTCSTVIVTIVSEYIIEYM